MLNKETLKTLKIELVTFSQHFYACVLLMILKNNQHDQDINTVQFLWISTNVTLEKRMLKKRDKINF